MASRLQARISGFSSPGAAASKTSAQGGVEAFQGNGPETGKPSTHKELAQGTPKKGGGASVLDSLKGVFRASLYGARIASQDSARSWLAKTFDATPDYETAIQYDDNMRTKLDKVNPNSIPQFLREQDISAAEAKTLGVSDVAKPEIDKEASKEMHKEDRKNLASNLTDGVLNSIFSGVGSKMSGSSAGTPPTAPSRDAGDPGGSDKAGEMNMMAFSDPNAAPDLGKVDEFGNMTVSGSDGMNRIYSPEGKLLGCESPAANMCLLPGNEGCI
jgi:hypothetical protein